MPSDGWDTGTKCANAVEPSAFGMRKAVGSIIRVGGGCEKNYVSYVMYFNCELCTSVGVTGVVSSADCGCVAFTGTGAVDDGDLLPAGASFSWVCCTLLICENRGFCFIKTLAQIA
jgi:hypothetical protein